MIGKVVSRPQFIVAGVIAAWSALLGGLSARPNGDPAVDIATVEALLHEAALQSERPTSVPPERRVRLRLEAAMESLLWQNQEIARAKEGVIDEDAKRRAALPHLPPGFVLVPNPPQSASEYAELAELARSQAPWLIEERSTLWARRAGYAAAFGFASFVATLVILAGIAWIWRFLLARLREVSDAIRGR